MLEVKYSIDALDYDMIRSLVWDAMSSKWKSRISAGSSYRASGTDICNSVIELAIKKELIRNPLQSSGQYTQTISTQTQSIVAQILWELINQGILYLPNPSNDIYDVTEYGKHLLASESHVPHDPEGYMECLKAKIPDIDVIILNYIEEAIKCYYYRLYLSSTTAVGCASEKAISLLIEAFTDYLPEKEGNKFQRAIKNRTIKIQFEEFSKRFDVRKSAIAKSHNDLIDGIDITIAGVFELLRKNRNSVGHPTGAEMTREEVFASLQMFVIYCKRIYDLIHYFTNNTADISEKSSK